MDWKNKLNAKYAVLLLIFLFPIFSAIVKHAGTGIFLFLMLAGLIWGWKSYQLLNDNEKIIIWGFVFFFAIIVLSLINTTDYLMAGRKFERYLRILGIIPVYYILVRLNIDIYKTLKLSLVVSAVIMLSFGIYEMVVLHKLYMEGPYYTTLFGYVSVLNAFMLVAVLLTHKLTKLEFSVCFSATVILLFCAIFSISRAAWLGALAIMVFLMVVFIFKEKIKLPLIKVIPVMIAMFLVVALNADHIHNRIAEGLNDIKTYNSKEISETSLGTRLSLWKDSILLFRNSPLLGTGVGDFDLERNKMIAAGLTPNTPSQGHSHNQFLGTLATTGILGLIGLFVGVFILPFWYFWKMFCSAKNEDTKYFSLIGMIVIIGFAFFSMGEVWLARNPTSNVYAFFIAISLAGITNARKKNNETI